MTREGGSKRKLGVSCNALTDRDATGYSVGLGSLYGHERDQ